MASGLYGITFLNSLNNTLALDLDNDTLKIMLVTSAYTPDFGVDDFKADVNGEVVGTGYTAGGETLEVVGTGYTAGGETLTSVTLTQSAGTITFDAADVTWTSSTITARGAVIYDNSLVSDPLICYIDFGSDQSSSSGDFLISFNAAGVFTLDLTP
jgi:hypothetical protein